MAKNKPVDRFIALFRGVNVGGKNSLPMKELIELFVQAGCRDVSNYIQSGNILFSANEQKAEEAEITIPVKIAERYGFKTSLVLRTKQQLTAAIADNPFLKEKAPEQDLHLYFLADYPKPEALQALDPDRCPPDRFAVQGREVYLQLPNGMARTKLTNTYFDTKLKTISTARNWKTVLKLSELL